MDALVYKVLHLAGVMTVFLGLGMGMLPEPVYRKKGMLFHGIGLLLILVSGFGMIAKLEYGFPGWMLVKLVLWLIIGVLPILAKRNVLPLAAAWTTALVLGIAAAYLGIFKSF